MEITPNGARPTGQGEAAYLTGDVRFDPVITAPDPARLRAVRVTFAPGARTAWHTHPLGQTLLVMSGLGLAQSWGGPLRLIRPGDTVWFGPGEKHWHGAAPANAMTHLAMQEALDGFAVTWLEQVSQDDYTQPPEG